MATLKATALREALSKALQVGRVEEPVTIAGCDIVLQNLTPDEYEAIVAETTELEDVEYFHAYQIGHVCRAICEIDGTDFRGIEYIEDEVLDSKNPNQLITREIERHEWIRTNLIRTWGREAISVAWQKFAELLVAAEKKAKEGVEFLTPDEDSETKFRRITNEMSEAEEDVPAELIEKILSEAGYIKTSSLQELDAAAKRVDELAKLDEEANNVTAAQETSTAPPVPPAPEPAPAPVSQQVAPPAAPQTTLPALTEDLQKILRSRQPLNQGATTPYVPPPGPPVAQQPVSSRSKVPEAIRRAAQQNTEALKGPQQPSIGRAAQIAALEGQLDPSADTGPAVIKPQGLNPRAPGLTIDAPPVIGVNKHYNPPQKL